jgi:hypothetical protein
MDITSLADDWDMVRDTATEAVAAAGLHGRSPVPRRLLDAATIEQVLVRDLFGERIAKLTVDTKAGGLLRTSTQRYKIFSSSSACL